MIGLIQRVQHASVTVNGKTLGRIEHGILVLLGVEQKDTSANAAKLAKRLLSYRVFADENDKMNLSVRDINGGILLVPQFTLAADTRSGTRASFTTAAPPDIAEALFDEIVILMRDQYEHIETGKFGADMQVSLLNDGPVTFWLNA